MEQLAKMHRYPHKEGEIKTTIYFAWLPERVNGKLIWLKRYEVVSEYQIRNWIAYTGRAIIAWFGGGWMPVKYTVL